MVKPDLADYTGSYDAWGNLTSQQRGSTTKSTAYDAQDDLLHWSSSVSSQQEWYLYDATGERVLRRSYDGTNTTLTVYAFGIEEHQYAYSGSGSTATNTGNTYYYTLAGRLLGTWDGSSATTTFLLTDSLGSVVSSFNNPASGAVMQGNQLYGPYGNQRLEWHGYAGAVVSHVLRALTGRSNSVIVSEMIQRATNGKSTFCR